MTTQKVRCSFADECIFFCGFREPDHHEKEGWWCRDTERNVRLVPCVPVTEQPEVGGLKAWLGEDRDGNKWLCLDEGETEEELRGIVVNECEGRFYTLQELQALKDAEWNRAIEVAVKVACAETMRVCGVETPLGELIEDCDTCPVEHIRKLKRQIGGEGGE